MNHPAKGSAVPPADPAPNVVKYYQRDFWSKENLKFSQPHYRLEKSSRIIKGIAQGTECSLLDVGCGPATLMRLLPSNIQYHGIDIAIHDQAPNLLEADIIKSPIRFAGKRFDIILAQGVFEYLGDFQAQKFSEIAEILKENGKFIVSYWNYAHRDKQIYWAHSNVRSIDDFRKELAQYFNIDSHFPVSHNWNHSSPIRKLNRAINMRLNLNIPLISPILAVEYFFLCSSRDPRRPATAESRDHRQAVEPG